MNDNDSNDNDNDNNNAYFTPWYLDISKVSPGPSISLIVCMSNARILDQMIPQNNQKMRMSGEDRPWFCTL